MLATMTDAHREWHRNSGVPMGLPGCPQDACHPDHMDPAELRRLTRQMEINFARMRGEEGEAVVRHGNHVHLSVAAHKACPDQWNPNAKPQGHGITQADLDALRTNDRPPRVERVTPPTQPAQPRVSVEEMQRWRTIPVGGNDTAYYALETADREHVAFFRVRRPSKGKYAGRTYVDQQSGDNFLRMTFHETAQVLSTIAKNPSAAAVLYGQRMERCAMCHRSLTDDVNKGPDGLTSLERGIGPDCYRKLM